MIGNKDFFLPVNRSLHQLLADNGVEHYDIEAQGAHTGEFAHEAFPVMFRFISTCFTEGRGHLWARPPVRARLSRGVGRGRSGGGCRLCRPAGASRPPLSARAAPA